jgi:hypothetical protein
MATRTDMSVERDGLVGSGPLLAGIGVCTALLTASFLGMVGLVSGNAVGVPTRLPLYVLGGSIAFVGALFALEGDSRDGSVVLGRAAIAALATFVLAVLGAEGVVYALAEPDAVVASHLFVYLLSAAIIASGLGYWAVQHWQDVRTAVADPRL